MTLNELSKLFYELVVQESYSTCMTVNMLSQSRERCSMTKLLYD